MLRRHEEFENGAAWSNSSESSDDSSSPQLPVGGLRNSTHDKVTHKILCMLDMIYSLVLLLLYSYHSMYLFFYLLLVKDWSVKCFLNVCLHLSNICIPSYFGYFLFITHGSQPRDFCLVGNYKVLTSFHSWFW